MMSEVCGKNVVQTRKAIFEFSASWAGGTEIYIIEVANYDLMFIEGGMKFIGFLKSIHTANSYWSWMVNNGKNSFPMTQ